MPITSSCQAFLLNKIEIGQFLYMKYKVGIVSKKPRNVVAVKSNKITPLSIKNGTNTKAVNAIVSANTVPKFFGNISVKDWFCLLKNVLSSVYVTLLNITRNLGTTNNVINAKKILSNISLIAILKHTPDQNIKFQKLSLFSRDLIQFITNLNSTILKSMISWFTILSKAIIKILVVIIFSFSQNIVFAQDLSELISMVEKEHNIPSGLLKAIVEVESGLKAYAVNIAGKAFIAKSQVDAVKIIRSYLKKGHTNIDIGLAQINWHWHGCNFSSINEMLTPKNNLKYAAKLLTDLYGKHGDWQKVVRLYHSAKPHHHRQYSRKVLLSWLDDSDGT